MTKEALTAKVSPKNLERLEDFAEREGISRSEAADRMIKQGLDVQESDMRLVPVKADGGTVLEDQLSDLQSDVESEIDDLQSDVDDLNQASQQSTRLTYLIAISLVWIGAEIGIGLPLWVTVTTGPLIVAALFGQLIKNRRDTN